MADSYVMEMVQVNSSNFSDDDKNVDFSAANIQIKTLDDSDGCCVRCYNAVWLDGRWIKLDARWNKMGVNMQFSLYGPILAFPIHLEYGEYFWQGIYAAPHAETMHILKQWNASSGIFRTS
jgi:hypothetical protein